MRRLQTSYQFMASKSKPIPSIVFPPETRLQILHHIVVKLESPSKNIRIDRWIRSENSICYGNHPRILATQTSKGDGISLSHILLEVNEANREDENVSRIKDFGYEAIIGVGGNETNIECAFQDN